MSKIAVPLSVPKKQQGNYQRNFKLATKNSGRLFLFAGDQKVEHLNKDFKGKGIDPSDASPKHLFEIANAIDGAVFATHIGLLDRYGSDYRTLPYILKLNGKTSLADDKDQLYNGSWLKAEEAVDFLKKSGLKAVGLGYTVYLGGKREAQMLKEASEMIRVAHQNGLLAIIWMYPRGPQVKDEEDIHLIAGGAGVAAALGADFVKLKYPYEKIKTAQQAKAFKEVVEAAGRTNVICVGGSKQADKDILKHLRYQLDNGTSGLAVGRNLHQRSLKEATKLGKAISAMIHKDLSLEKSLKLLK